DFIDHPPWFEACRDTRRHSNESAPPGHGRPAQVVGWLGGWVVEEPEGQTGDSPTTQPPENNPPARREPPGDGAGLVKHSRDCRQVGSNPLTRRPRPAHPRDGDSPSSTGGPL